MVHLKRYGEKKKEASPSPRVKEKKNPHPFKIDRFVRASRITLALSRSAVASCG